ncbi:MAG: hypothetical protein ACI8RZ_006201, partial [Myxococcota bacterium]
MPPPLKPRPRIATLFMTLPILFGGALMVSVGLLAVMAWIGGEAEGERVDIVLAGDCTHEALPMVKLRVADIGLGEPDFAVTNQEITIRATLPGADDAVERESIPHMLASAGDLTVTLGEEVLVSRAEVERAELQLGDSGEAIAVAFITEAAQERMNVAIDADPEGSLQIRMDGNLIVDRPSIGRIVG